jgi:hypothetical protein
VTQEFTGNARLYPDCPHSSGSTLLVGVSCFIGEQEFEVDALLDTGAEWSILETSVAAHLGYDGTIEGMPLTMSTRLGRMEGQVVPISVSFPAENGEDLTSTPNGSSASTGKDRRYSVGEDF